MKKKFEINIPKLIRNISGTLTAFICVSLILIFGIMPIFKCSLCPISGSNKKSVYSKDTLVFLRDAKPEKLKKGDVVVYYEGKDAVGVKVISNNETTKSVQVMGEDDIPLQLKYRRISGKAVGFSLPMMGRYANWLVNGAGIKVSVILNGILFLVFAVSAVMTHEDF